jgi:hypothetical protein
MEENSMRNNGNGSSSERLARGLGWFSIGLGLAQILAPRAIGRLVGIRNHRALIAAVGVREIASGIGILSQVKPKAWVWARVGGDVMDLALLGSALTGRKSARTRLATTTAVGGARFRSVGPSRSRSRPRSCIVSGAILKTFRGSWAIFNPCKPSINDARTG